MFITVLLPLVWKLAKALIYKKVKLTKYTYIEYVTSSELGLPPLPLFRKRVCPSPQPEPKGGGGCTVPTTGVKAEHSANSVVKLKQKFWPGRILIRNNNLGSDLFDALIYTYILYCTLYRIVPLKNLRVFLRIVYTTFPLVFMIWNCSKG